MKLISALKVTEGCRPLPVCCAAPRAGHMRNASDRIHPTEDLDLRGSHICLLLATTAFIRKCLCLLRRVAAVDHDVLDDSAPNASERRGVLVFG